MTFTDLGLSQPVLQALAAKGYTNPTPIQAQAIPLVLEGRDIMGIAQTGTGKTAAFMLPAIDNLRAAGRPTPFKSCRMLVLAPTRELAGQIAQSAKDYGALAGLTVQCIVGGTSVGKDINKLHRGTDILVATPGRLLDLIDQRAFKLSDLEILVLDEADQMLDLGFIHALRKIVSLVPRDRQTLLFSATMPSSIRDLAGKYLTNPAQVSVAPAATTAERVEQYVCFVNQNEKQALLNVALRKGFAQDEIDRVLVFTRTKHGADRVVKHLERAGVDAAAIHGNKSQSQRERALEAFRRGQTRVLVATDIAARGIDVSGVSHVFNYELPNVAEQYVHRIGRTARAGADGVAIAFCAPDEREYLRDIQKLTKVELVQVPLPEAFNEEVAKVRKAGPVTSDVNSRPPQRSGRREGSKVGKPHADVQVRRRGAKPEGDRTAASSTGDRNGPNRNRNRRRGGGGGGPRQAARG